jgi:hypothetical protein
VDAAREEATRSERSSRHGGEVASHGARRVRWAARWAAWRAWAAGAASERPGRGCGCAQRSPITSSARPKAASSSAVRGFWNNDAKLRAQHTSADKIKSGQRARAAAADNSADSVAAHRSEKRAERRMCAARHALPKNRLITHDRMRSQQRYSGTHSKRASARDARGRSARDATRLNVRMQLEGLLEQRDACARRVGVARHRPAIRECAGGAIAPADKRDGLGGAEQRRLAVRLALLEELPALYAVLGVSRAQPRRAQEADVARLKRDDQLVVERRERGECTCLEAVRPEATRLLRFCLVRHSSDL